MKILRKIGNAVCCVFNSNRRFLHDARKGRYNALPDDEYLKRLYKASLGKEPDLENPESFNEKLQWLKLHMRKPEYTRMVDKYLVREYISEKLGEEFLIPLLGVWDDPGEIDFDALPPRFVLKCNHNSSYGMCICRDKSKLNKKQVIKELREGLAHDFYLQTREWPYRDVPRKIIAEQYMEQSDGSELKDYKIHCFNGKPEFILVCSDRFSKDGLKEDFYDTDWNRMELHRPGRPHSDGIPKPEKLPEMLKYAAALAEGLPFVRIDFYYIDQKIYFGEITFFPTSGLKPFEPENADMELGELLRIQ